MKIGEYETHPYADAFPLLEGEKYDEFKQRILEDGLISKEVWLYEGKLLDGRNRLRAVGDLGTKTKLTFREYTGDNPIGFVRSLNLDGRRNMSPSVCALAACRLAQLKPGRPKKSRTSTEMTKGELAKTFGVSVSSIEDAKVVLGRGAPELVQAVERDQVKLSEAIELALLPHEEQRTALEQRKQETTEKAKRAVTRRASAPKNDEAPATTLTPAAATKQLVRTVTTALQELGATVKGMTANELQLAYGGHVFTLSLQRSDAEAAA